DRIWIDSPGLFSTHWIKASFFVRSCPSGVARTDECIHQLIFFSSFKFKIHFATQFADSTHDDVRCFSPSHPNAIKLPGSSLDSSFLPIAWHSCGPKK